MKKVTSIIIVVLFILSISPGFASEESFKAFVKKVMAEEKISGRAEIKAETASYLIIIFGLKNAMKQFKYDKLTGIEEIKEIKKFDDAPSVWDQTPEERLAEALTTYGQEVN